jgi:hypothetical protein
MPVKYCSPKVAKKEDYNPKSSKSAIEISNDVVLTVLKSLVVLGEKILDRQTVVGAF